MRIVVTRGAGRIGSSLVASLTHIGHEAAFYFRAALEKRSLTPGPGARLGAITLKDWLRADVMAA